MKAKITTIAVAVILIFLGCLGDTQELEAKMRLARSLVWDQKYQEAIPILSAVIDTEDSLPAALALRGTCYSFLGDQDSAMLDFRRVLIQGDATCDQKMNALSDIANIYLGIGMHDSTARLVGEMIRQRRNCQSSIYSLTRLYVQLSTIKINSGEFETASALLDSAQNLGIDTFTFATTRAYLFSRMNEPDSAIQWLSMGLTTKDTSEKAYINWGNLYLDRGNLLHKISNLRAACTDWQKALDLGILDSQSKLDSFCSGKLRGAPASH